MSILRTALALLVLLAAPLAAQAQLFRAYLSSTGSDLNPCTLPAPCRLLPAALTAVASGGEVWILDSANYNPGTVDITKSVTILAVPGALGSFVSTGGPALRVNTTGVVMLRNLSFAPVAGAVSTQGVQMIAAGDLGIEDCRFARLTTGGIRVEAGIVHVSGTLVRNSSPGLYVGTGAKATVVRSTFTRNDIQLLADAGVAGTAQLAVSDTSVSDGNFGVVAQSTVVNGIAKVSVTGSTLARNSSYGGLSQSLAASASLLTITGSHVTQNGVGVGVSSVGARVFVSGNTFSDQAFNALSVVNIGGLIETGQNNVGTTNAAASSPATPATPF